MSLKVAVIAVCYLNQSSVKHKFVSRYDAFKFLSNAYDLSEFQMKALEIDLSLNLLSRDGFPTYDFYLIEW